MHQPYSHKGGWNRLMHMTFSRGEYLYTGLKGYTCRDSMWPLIYIYLHMHVGVTFCIFWASWIWYEVYLHVNAKMIKYVWWWFIYCRWFMCHSRMLLSIWYATLLKHMGTWMNVMESKGLTNFLVCRNFLKTKGSCTL